MDLSASPFLISLNANLLFSLFIVSQQEIQLCKCLGLQPKVNTHALLKLLTCKSDVGVRLRIVGLDCQIGGATNQSNRPLTATVTAFVTVAICLPPIIGKLKQYSGKVKLKFKSRIIINFKLKQYSGKVSISQS